MTHFRPSMIATVVASALTVGSIGAVNATPLKQLNIDPASLAQFTKSSKGASAKALASLKTVSGMKSNFDAKLNKTTFEWQRREHVRPEMIMVEPEQRNAFAAKHYLSALTGMATGKAAGGSQAVLQNIHDLKRGAIIAKYTQQVNGVEVFNRAYNVMMDQDHNFVAGSGYFAEVSPSMTTITKANRDDSFGNPADAITTAYGDMGGEGIQLTPLRTQDNYTTFSTSNDDAAVKQMVGTPRSKQVYFEHKNKLVAAHYVEVQVAEKDSVDSDYFSYVIDAKTQKVLFKMDLKAHSDEFSYRAYADTAAPYAPWDSPHGNVNPAESADQIDPSEIMDAPMVTLTSGPISTQDPWLTEGSTETIGNNVAAYVDVIPGNGLTFGDYTAEITSAGTFDYKIDTSLKEYSVHNRKAAIVNLFYMNNYLHDQFYDHGFDEASGNAQYDNFERGGEGHDTLLAEVQDYSGTNNANMSTPADGASPRMQMYLWDGAKNGVHYGVTVTSHDDIGMLDSVGTASYGLQEFAMSGNVVRLDDGVSEVDDGAGGTIETSAKDGCEPAINPEALAGNIALIDRGACSFDVKVGHAEAAGAVAVLIANNRDGDRATNMSGDGPTIPSLMVSQNVGAAIDGHLDAAETVSVDMFGKENKPQRASSWDNAIVAHEWGHYISNRLVGNASGLSNIQGRGMGEGWGDFHALLTVSSADEATIAGNDMFQKPYGGITYVGSFYHGIRTYPYTTDMEINKHTFNSVADNPAVHAIGNVWASHLWDAFVGLINSDHYDYAHAKSAMMDYLVAGYKMTPNAPTITEARDAILAAAYANSHDDYNIILAAFARRGMGLGAVSPDRSSTDLTGIVESYSVTHSELELTSHSMYVDYEGLTTGYCSNDGILDKGETGAVSFTIANRGSEAYEGVTGMVEVTSGHDVTFANGGAVSFGDLGVTGSMTSAPLEFMLNDAGTADTLTMKVTFPDLVDASGGQEYMITTAVNYDFEEIPLVGTAAGSGAETIAFLNDFKEHVMAGGEDAVGSGYLTGDYAQFWRDNGIDMGDYSMFIRNNGYYTDIAYETKPITVGLNGNFVMYWLHLYDFEQDFDGGVVEISINGEPWLDALDAAGTFLGGGYSGNLIAHSSQPLPDRAAFTGFGAEFAGVWFPTWMNGNTVKMRFRAGSDGGAAATGWVIDDLYFDNIVSAPFTSVIPGDTNACDNRLPWVAAGEDQSVNEGAAVTLSVEAVDANAGDALTYMWEQVSGPAVELTGADTAAPTFTAPAVEADSDIELMVTVSDGHGMVHDSVMVHVVDVPVVVAPTPAPEVVQRSSGGSTGLLGLLLLPLAFIRRRLQK